MYDASDRKSVRAAEKDAKLASTQRREIVTALMSTAPGRAWICDLLERCHVFATTFNRDALAMAFAEGERNIGLGILVEDLMAACPDQYVVMMRERNDRDLARASRNDRNAGDRDEPSGGPEDPSPGDD